MTKSVAGREASIACRLRSLVCLCLLAMGCSLPRPGSASPSPSGATHPTACGSFIQWYLVKDWTDAQWQAEFHAMRELGMRTLVFAPTVESKPQIALYPTALPGYHLPEGSSDLV